MPSGVTPRPEAGKQPITVGVMMRTSKGTAGLAGGAFIVLPDTVTAVGHIQLAALSLIVGIDRILNQGRVFINAFGNAVATIVIVGERLRYRTQAPTGSRARRVRSSLGAMSTSPTGGILQAAEQQGG
ncbi:cation:dicarboxylate symporter family transporter [Streptomyces sp. NPDC057298]|uniref:cation:dicarboxylate symporter family transporter n=1 Tax=Streptomyces sp. NPDC057298 TaxID=3346091 RepID=UPI00362D9921